MSTKSNHRRQAFPSMELLAVVTILGVIASNVIPRVTSSADTAKAKVNAHNMGTINAAVERYYIENGSWPSSDLNELDVVNYFPDGLPVNPVSGSAYTLNATSHRLN